MGVPHLGRNYPWGAGRCPSREEKRGIFFRDFFFTKYFAVRSAALAWLAVCPVPLNLLREKIAVASDVSGLSDHRPPS